MPPKTRDDNLLVHQVEDEIVVYDRTRKEAHRLNKSVAKVWSRLDGKRSMSEIASGLDLDESVVALAIDDLANAQLLESSEPLSVSRRSALRRVASGAAVGVLLPVVTSIPAPLAAMARSRRRRPLRDCEWVGRRYGFGSRKYRQCISRLHQ